MWNVYYITGVANLWPAGQMWPFLNSGEQKKSPKNMGELAKKYELMALSKKGLEFSHFLAHLPQKVGDPCYITYNVYHELFVQTTGPSSKLRAAVLDMCAVQPGD